MSIYINKLIPRPYKNIVLLTDFGESDNFVGVMKGVIFTINPKVNIIDITHNIPPQDIFKASFILKYSYRYFPKNSIFLIVVDPGVGTKRDILIVENKKYTFIAPDNGVLSSIINNKSKIFKLQIPNKYINIPETSTFHGRDIFSPLAGFISKGVPIRKLSSPIFKYKKINFPEPSVKNNIIKGEIIYIDKFGNCISNINYNLIKNSRKVRIFIKDKIITKIAQNYQEVKDIGAINNSFNLIEIFKKNKSAEKSLKIKVNDKIEILVID